MSFRTRVDISSNRQIKQHVATITNLSGATTFGLPFSALTTGPNLLTSGITQSYSTITSTFSGNSGTTNYTWFDSRMNLANNSLSAITPSNSASTQNTGQLYSGTSFITIDGNTSATLYTGVSFNILVSGMTILSGGTYSGSVVTNKLDILSAATLDYTGRTIWVDTSGITRTDRLLVGPLVSGITEVIDINGNARIRNISSSASSGALYYTSNGTLTTNTSDRRFKTNIETIPNALDKLLKLRGVYYNWNETPNTNKRIGFIAQEINDAVPELSFINDNTEEKYMGVHYENTTALIVEAIKELYSGNSIFNSRIETQTILAEDNDIELNVSGNTNTAIGGGIRVLYAIADNKSAELITDNNGNWITNNIFKPSGLIIPTYTPVSSSDSSDSYGNITQDDDYLYIKLSNKWKRIKLENF